VTSAAAQQQASSSVPQTLVVRPARTADVPAIASIIDGYVNGRILLGKERVTLYEDVQEFQVAQVVSGDGAGPDGGPVVGCGALHVLWEDLGEIRTLAVDPAWHGHSVGHRVLDALVVQARALGLRRLFCLTFEVDFFTRQGFHAIAGTPVEPDVYAELLRSMDEGVAEFLDLARVKPNTLGNTRMLRDL
jgi:amino-acid N-acetyltransferase